MQPFETKNAEMNMTITSINIQLFQRKSKMEIINYNVISNITKTELYSGENLNQFSRVSGHCDAVYMQMGTF